MRHVNDVEASSPPLGSQRGHTPGGWLLAFILLGSLSLNLYNITFPLGYHFDEPKKVEFVRNGTQDFHQPILLLQLARAAHRVVQVSDEHSRAVLGRLVSALAGVVSVYLAFVLARQTLETSWALLAAAGVAASPTMVLHAHYFKEDLVLTATILGSFACLVRLIKREGNTGILALGLSTGLAFSAKYVGILLLPVYLLCPVAAAPFARGRRYYYSLAAALGVAVVVFLVVNWPLVDEPRRFLRGVRWEASHAVHGHTLRTDAFSHLFGFHLMNSIIPGISLPVTLLGVAWMVYAAATWRRLVWQDRLWLLYVVMLYAVLELVPLKPEPDFGRYVLPIVPFLVYFAVRFMRLLAGRAKGWLGKSIFGLMTALIVLAVPLTDALLLDYHLDRDTRRHAGAWLAATGRHAVFEAYAAPRWDVWSVAELDVARLRQEGISYLVASSFVYERYYRGSHLRGQDPEVYATHRRYEQLFASYPYIEFRPAHRSFGFSNPILRVIDIRAGAGRSDEGAR